MARNHHSEPREGTFRVETVDDTFGPIIVEYLTDARGASISVSGRAIPTSTLHRSGPPRRTDTPIGSRDASLLDLVVDGDRSHRLSPSPGGYSRRSYRVVVEHSDSIRLFTAASPTTHRLVRGPRYLGSNEIGLFTSSMTEVYAEWSVEIQVAGLSAPAVTPDATDCSIGYLLAMSFGTGAKLLLPAIVSGAIEAVFPT